ncbi:DUF2787 domain-containing protein [Vibrio metschnikovii]|nr:DUF2787 domain-containing protein [Vibrio metschnikovii]
MSQLTFVTSTLPISHKLHNVLNEQLSASSLSSSALEAQRLLVFHFRDKAYSAENGGFHPVEIALSKMADAWHIDYLTEFAYFGHPYPELERCLDFNFQRGEFFAAYQGWQPIKGSHEAQSLYQLWEHNFLAYVEMGVFDDITLR